MKIGIYTGNTIPTGGGAYTLIETIKKDIEKTNSKHAISFLYESKRKKHDQEIDGITYRNVYNPKNRSVIFRCIRKIRGLIGLVTPCPSLLDSILRSEKYDFLWILGPYDIDVTIPYAFTVWDLGHRTQPAFPEVSVHGWSWDSREETYKKMLYKATYVITGNETGKKEILDNYPMNPEKIKIIPFPVPAFCYDHTDIPSNLDGIKEPFVFYPAQFWAHKNHIAIVEAIALLRAKYNTDIYCYFVGSDKGNGRYIESEIRKNRVDDLVFNLGFVEISELKYLYSRALAMTFMSLLGPNNLPPLEAAAFGCPLIISDLPGHLEQMEGAALPVNATNPESIAEAILRILTDSIFRDELVIKEKKLAQKYKNYSYFDEMSTVFDSFSLLKKTWGQTSENRIE